MHACRTTSVEDCAVRTCYLLPSSAIGSRKLGGTQYWWWARQLGSVLSHRFSLALRVFGNCCVFFVVVEVTLLLWVFAVYSIRNKNATDLQSLLL